MRTVESFAHGRVNLIGEHTDYNGGYVLPTVIPQMTEVKVTAREDNVVMATSQGFAHFKYRLGEERANAQWADYLQGVTAILRKEGYELSGFDCEIQSSVPVGSGLSSSAAFEVSVLKALKGLFNLPLTELQIAVLGQRVENEFVGAKVGIMDQMVCSLGRPGEALFIDTNTLSYQALPLPLADLEFLVINSRVIHSNVQGGYNQRRIQCEEACQRLRVKQLRDLTSEDIPKLQSLPRVLRRRARHVITENERVLAAVKALKEKDFARLGDLFKESHASMRGDFEITVPEIDLLVELTSQDPACWGSRMTGGGFGGSIVALTQPGAARELGQRVLKIYKARTGISGVMLVPEPASSAPASRGAEANSPPR